MKRLYPLIFLLLCTSQPVINFTTANVVDSSCSLGRSILYWIILFFSSILFYLFLHKAIKKDKTFSYIFAGLTVLVIFNLFYVEMGLVSILGESFRFRYFLLVIPLCLISLFGLAKLFSKNEKNSQILMVFILSLISVDVLLYIKSIDFNEKVKISSYSHSKVEPENTPNVYYIIPDMFVGPEAFKQASGGQELKIPKELEQRNFQVSYNSFSTAPATRLSLAQVFGMDYLLAQFDELGSSTFKELTEVYSNGNNPVIQGFKDRGYKYIRFADSYVTLCDGKEDECRQKSMLFNTQDVQFVERFKLVTFLNHYFLRGNTLTYPGAMEPDEFIDYLPKKNEGPFFLLMHFSIPHPPIRYDEECHFYPEGSKEYEQFNNTFEFAQTPQARFNSIIPQIRCSEKLLIKFVDSIQANDPEGIIIIQADHGTKTKNQDETSIAEFTDEQFFENFNILSAFHLPQQCKKYVNNNFSPVNNFRLVFGCIDNVEPKLLPSRSFLAQYNQLSVQQGEKVGVKEWKYDINQLNKQASS